jgi:ABC-type nickel/cobalt efflux system permease component RcnA
MVQEPAGLMAFVVATGLIHGAERGHGWPVADAYGFARDDPWRHGIAAAVVLGIGHLVSAVVLAFLWLKSETGLGRVPWLDFSL